MTSIAYVLHEHGFEGEKVLKILKDIEDVADSMVDDYIAFNDIRKVLKDEYDFEIRMRGDAYGEKVCIGICGMPFLPLGG